MHNRFWQRRTKRHARSRSIFNICPRRVASDAVFLPFRHAQFKFTWGISHSDFITRKVYPRERNPYSLFPFAKLSFFPSPRESAPPRHAVKRVAFMRRAKVSGEEPRSRAVLSLKSASELFLAREPTGTRMRLFLFSFFLQHALG